MDSCPIFIKELASMTKTKPKRQQRKVNVKAANENWGGMSLWLPPALSRDLVDEGIVNRLSLGSDLEDPHSGGTFGVRF